VQYWADGDSRRISAHWKAGETLVTHDGITGRTGPRVQPAGH
jgi:hypothetical protein